MLVRGRSRGGGLVARASSETKDFPSGRLHPTSLPPRAHRGRLLLFTSLPTGLEQRAKEREGNR